MRAHTHTVVRTDSSKKIGRVEKARRVGHTRGEGYGADCGQTAWSRSRRRACAISAQAADCYRTRPQIASTLESHCSNVPADRRSSSAKRIRPKIPGSTSKLGTERRARRASLSRGALSPMRNSKCAVYAGAAREVTAWDRIGDQRRGTAQPRRNARWGPSELPSPHVGEKGARFPTLFARRDPIGCGIGRGPNRAG